MSPSARPFGTTNPGRKVVGAIMRRMFRTILILSAILFTFDHELVAQVLEARVLAKDGVGAITRTSLALTLRARGCDGTSDLIPDGSRLVSNDLVTLVDERGRGIFRGSGAIVAPGGRAVIQFTIHGIVGLPAIENFPGCWAPLGHLEATLDPVPTFEADTAILDARLSADFVVSEVPSPFETYSARLDGFVTTALAAVSIAPERPAYEADEPIAAFVKNGSSMTIEASYGRSYCTIVGLERLVRDSWEVTSACPLERVLPPPPMTIGAGATLRVPLPPEGAMPSGNQPGIYRLAVSYRSSQTSPTLLVVSAPFNITPSTPSPPAVGSPLIVTDKGSYRFGEPILAKIANDGDLAFETHDHQSYCSFLTLERLEQAGWTGVAPCALGSPTLPVRIAPRSSLAVTLPSGPVVAQVAPGFYRLTVEGHFVDAGGKPVEPAVRIQSRTFVVYAVRSFNPGDRG
jgi:hypothetical protein